MTIGVLAILLVPTIAKAQELPRPGVTRDNPLYLFDRFAEKVRVMMQSNNARKAELRVSQADERLAEVKKLAVQNKTREMNQTLEDYEEAVGDAKRHAERVRTRARKKNTLQLVKTATERHKTVLEDVRRIAPSQAKPAIGRAINSGGRAGQAAEDSLSLMGQTYTEER